MHAFEKLVCIERLATTNCLDQVGLFFLLIFVNVFRIICCEFFYDKKLKKFRNESSEDEI